MGNRAGGMTPDEFVQKWSKAQLSERAASQEHFIDLCHLIDQPTPAEADSTGDDYCFEKHVKVVGAASKGSKGAGGFVDVANLLALNHARAKGPVKQSASETDAGTEKRKKPPDMTRSH